MESKEYESIGVLSDEEGIYEQVMVLRNGLPHQIYIIPVCDTVGWYKDLIGGSNEGLR